jgi:hypothetical protein
MSQPASSSNTSGLEQTMLQAILDLPRATLEHGKEDKKAKEKTAKEGLRTVLAKARALREGSYTAEAVALLLEGGLEKNGLDLPKLIVYWWPCWRARWSKSSEEQRRQLV